jgi:hypothetical protein
MLLAPTPTYGSDRSGFICLFRFVDGAGKPIVAEEAAQRIGQSGEGGENGFVWVHFDLTAAAAEKWLATHLALPPAFLKAATLDAGRPPRREACQAGERAPCARAPAQASRAGTGVALSTAQPSGAMDFGMRSARAVAGDQGILRGAERASGGGEIDATAMWCTAGSAAFTELYSFPVKT